MNTASSKFSVGQKIVYPSQGVGEIREITEKKFRDSVLLYYVIYLPVSDMVVMAPVEKSDEIGIRAIVDPDGAQYALSLLSESFEPVTSDWKLRYQMNLDLLKKGSVADIAVIVRSLYQRSKVKELPLQERKLYDSARKLLEDEVSLSLGVSKEEIETLILERLEPPGSVVSGVAVTVDDDDDDIDMSGDENLSSDSEEDDDFDGDSMEDE